MHFEYIKGILSVLAVSCLAWIVTSMVADWRIGHSCRRCEDAAEIRGSEFEAKVAIVLIALWLLGACISGLLYG